MDLLEFEDWREFFEKLHDWGYSRDFTYDRTTEDFQRFIKLFIKESYL